jgi:hypothetical protein
VANTALDPNRRFVAASLRVLLTDLIDYAGLFPPAAVSMDPAVENYSRYLTSEDEWALARFVVPMSRLSEFEAARDKCTRNHSVWQLSGLLGSDVEGESAAIRQFNDRNSSVTKIDAVESKAATQEDVRRVIVSIPRGVSVFFEVRPDLASTLLPVIREAGAQAKLRTGGVTPDLFPAPGTVSCFIHQCASARVGFKATAGLHHPLRCTKPLTYETNAPTGVMHGFLNVFFAAALALNGASEAALTRTLENQDAGAFDFTDDGVRFRDWFLTTGQLETARRTFAVSFGSCSFEEPLTDLRELGLL